MKFYTIFALFILFIRCILIVGVERERLPNPLPDKLYDGLMEALKDKMKISRDSDAETRRIYRYYNSKKYERKKTYNPVTEMEQELLVYHSTHHGVLIVPREGEVSLIIKHFYKKYKGENRVKLFERIRSFYCGISCHRIQEWINNNQEHFTRNPVFLNKDELTPIVATVPMERIQVDLVDFSSCKSKMNGKTYSYILAVLDVFSRFLSLTPLVKKESFEISFTLRSYFRTFGQPDIVQTDRGSEFKGDVEKALDELGIKKIESRSYHPQM